MAEIPYPIVFDRARAQQRPHRKSKLGCKVCKARKIKCDEVRPVCGNCYRRFPNPEEECEFEYNSPQRGFSPSSANEPRPSTSRASSISTTFSSSLPTSRSMELRLFHHYSTVTCLTMPTCEEEAGIRMWKTTIPSLAFECTYVYSAILAISALHLLSLTPDDIALKAATYQYIDETVSTHREEMNVPNSSNSVNRLATSVLLTLHAKLRTICERTTSGPYSLPINYFILQHGANDMFLSTPEWGSAFTAYVAVYSHLAPHLQPPAPPQPENHAYINRDFPYDPLPNYVEFDESLLLDRKELYVHALTYISLIKECILKGENPSWIRHRLGIFPTTLRKGFCTLIQEEDPLCLLIVARLFALLKFVDEPWYLQGTAEYEVRGLETMLPDEWKWGMEWPLGILENSSLFMS
ncbi:hypothetical protein L207DRAFT_448576 [Hyaloscypha variabilis F]|uniref:Zn(2)-C6 fungal-type domain-containing protein n=1 Tax=Hyaloscypha variabilis (strain UAMH 11265 / GT02V1 / F) TaxID=1149755 RepID=A0A2J6S8H9_HYAVF|nr:hypothetical protein L207DRAFT_448576 [Hyaloscypha variabilis F]